MSTFPSDSAAAYEPRRFRTTVPFYSRYRLHYPARLTARVGEMVGLKPGDSVLDLGCGPGLLALAYAKAGMQVTAMDPEPDMLEAARIAAAEAGVAMTFIQGSSYDLPAGIGPCVLVTMGRAFHWMDRAATLTRLDDLVAPGGAVALFGENHPDTEENDWRQIVFALGEAYGLESARYFIQAGRRYGPHSHESYLFASAFCEIDSAGVFIRQRLDLDTVVGRVLSLSIFSPEKLGERQGAFEAELRRRLLAFRPQGDFIEIAEMTAIVARRP